MSEIRMRDGWESQARNWADFARRPGLDWAHEQINLPSFLELLPPPAGPVLDLGCGEGRVSRDLRARGYAVTGVDAAPTMLLLAAAHERAQPVALADAAALPFRSESFDLVVAYMSLHDIDAMPDTVGEAARVLRPSGHLVAAIPHPVNSAGDFESRDGRAPFVIAGSYLASGPADWSRERDGIRLTFHSEHRPIEAYSRALEASGLLIEAIREVGAPQAGSPDADPALHRFRRIPLFLHFRAVKPGSRFGEDFSTP
jgi:SAM-dependent methyltransferase